MCKVSVLVATYNQEKYIAKTLQSVANQKTDFEYEVIVGDDASKDSTGKIVEEFGKKYPDIIRPVVREKNIGAYRNFLDLLGRAKGEYLALLEGDDYWIDEEKLQKQVTFLDSHPDHVAVFGKRIVIDENDDRNEEAEKYIPYFRGGEYTSRDYEEYILPGQTATSMYRKDTVFRLMDTFRKNKKIMPRVPVVDCFLVLGIMSFGKIYTLSDYLAAYRYILDKNSGSWSSKNDYYSVRNMLFYLYGMKEMERVGKHLGIELNFDKRRWYEFEKVAGYKGKMSILSINLIRFFIWLWYRDKKNFLTLLKDRHR